MRRIVQVRRRKDILRRRLVEVRRRAQIIVVVTVTLISTLAIIDIPAELELIV